MTRFTAWMVLVLATVLPGPLFAADSGLTRNLGEEYAAYSTERFRVYSTEEAWAHQVMTLLERTHDRFYDSFTSGGFDPEPIGERLVFLWFSDRDAFDDYALRADRADMSWSEGYYSARTNRVALVHQGGGGRTTATAVAAMEDARAHAAAMERGSEHDPRPRLGSEYRLDIAKTTHEAAHQLAFNSGLQKRGVMYPVWVSEGLATNFEIGLSGEFGLEADNPVRRRRLVGTWERGGLIPLRELIVTTVVTTTAPWTPSELYAQSWGFFRFLFQERRGELVRYLDALDQLDRGWRDERTLVREFNAAFGSVAALQGAWERFLGSLSSGAVETPRLSKNE